MWLGAVGAFQPAVLSVWECAVGGWAADGSGVHRAPFGSDDALGLYYYGSRYYDPLLGRFAQADSIVPDTSNPQSLNRFAYVLNNPLKHTDPTGHRECDLECQIENDQVDPIMIHYGEALSGLSCYGVVECLGGGNPNSVVSKAASGDPIAALDLVTPTHVGLRFQIEVNSNLQNIPGSITVGAQSIYNRHGHRVANNVDFTYERGPTPFTLFPLGVSITAGPAIGWFSSDVTQVTRDYSGVASATVAGGQALSVAANVVPTIDPIYGTTPITAYLGIGMGLAYLSLAGGVVKSIYDNEITDLLPYR